LTHIQLAAIGTTLYLLGGLGSGSAASGSAWSLDTATTPLTWVSLQPMPAGYERGGAVTVAAPPRIYLLGGQNASGALATNLFYDTLAQTWGPPTVPTIPDLPAPRTQAAGMWDSDGDLVVAGGFGSDGTPEADTWQLPLGATAWATGSNMPQARGGGAYGTIEGGLLYAGGEAATSTCTTPCPVTTVQSYNLLVDQWPPGLTTDMPMPTAGTPGAAIGQQLFVPGGTRSAELEPTDTLYVYSPFNAGE
jgi:N-acetylneuraminic acid mutarotase